MNVGVGMLCPSSGHTIHKQIPLLFVTRRVSNTLKKDRLILLMVIKTCFELIKMIKMKIYFSIFRIYLCF